MMSETEVSVYCYWKGCIKYGRNGVYYEGSTPKLIKVMQKTELYKLLDKLYLLTGLDSGDHHRLKFRIFGRYPYEVVQQSSMVKYLLLPVVDNTSLETMLELPSNHACIKYVELYLEVKSDGVLDTTALGSLDPCTCLKRQRIDDVAVILERNKNSNGWISEEEEDDVGGIGVSKPCLSSLWLDDHDMRVGLCFKDDDELKKAVDWYSIKSQRKCIVREAEKDDECMFECTRWKCKWTLEAARLGKHGLFEIIKYTGPHTCCPTDPEEDFDLVFKADEIERAVRQHPTQSYAELKKWWKDKFSYELTNEQVETEKTEAIKRVFGDWDQSFEDLPKLMAILHSSNKMIVDWKYDLYPNPKFASFCGVFWAFSQSVEGFQHCRPLIIVDTKDLNDEYQLKLMIASGVDAANNFFHLAFAVTKEVSTDSWRWFLNQIREKVTQRKELCLISSAHPNIVAVVNEPGSLWQEPWAYHRFCLDGFCTQFRGVFKDYGLNYLVKQAGYTSQKEKFDSYMKNIEKRNSEAKKWLDQFPQSQWALAHDNGRRYNIMNTPYLSAVFKNSRLANHVLTGYVLLLFDELRDLFDWANRCARAFLNGCGDVYTDPVMEKLEEFRKCSVTHIVMPLDNNAFQVTTTQSEKDEWIVQLSVTQSDALRQQTLVLELKVQVCGCQT